jgi:glutaredoxin
MRKLDVCRSNSASSLAPDLSCWSGALKRIAAAIAFLILVPDAGHSGCGQQVFLFSAFWCPACRSTEAFLDQHQIGYRRFEVTDNVLVKRFMRENFGTIGVPIVVVDGVYRIGYDPDWLQSALCLP